MDVKRYTKGTKLSLRIIGLFMVITLLSGTLLPVGVMATTGEEIGIPEEVLPPEEPTDSEEETPEDVDEADAVSEQETADDTITEETPDSEEGQPAEEPTPDSEPETEEETAAETPTDDVPDSEEEPVKTEDDTVPDTVPDEGPAEEQTQPEENADEPVSDEETADDVPVVDDAADAVLGDIAGDELETGNDAADELVWDDPEDLNSLAESFFEALSDKAFATAEILEFAEGAVEALTGAVLKITELAVDDLGELFVNYVGEEIQNYAVFDLGFYLDDESEVEPGTEVAVTVDLTEYLADQAYDPASLVLYHHEEDEWGEVVNTAAVASYEDGGITVDEETGAVTAMFTVNSFSAFTLRWSNTEENVESEGQELSFYDLLMSAPTCEEVFNLLNSDPDAAYALTTEELTALRERVSTMEDPDENDYRTDVLDTLNYLIELQSGCTCGAEDGIHDVECPEYGTEVLPDDVAVTYAVGDPVGTDDTYPVKAAPGVKVRLFNYNADINNQGLGEKGFKFWTDTGNSKEQSVDGAGTKGDYNGAGGWWEGEKPPMTGTLNIKDGYPDTTITGVTDSSMAYLFDDSEVSGKTIWAPKQADGSHFLKDGGGLFRDIGNGYFEYDSAMNAAYYDSEAGQFVLYNNTIIRPSYTSVGNSSNPSDDTLVTAGNFLPFNKLVEGTDGTVNSSFSTWQNKNYGGASTYAYQLKDKTDLWFGMVVEFEFLMPKDGLVNDQQMVFNFQGDDDVFVYIDDQLVLDIGGTHSAQSGTINFATGIATDPTGTKTFESIFNGTSTKLNSDGTFEDYTVHKLKFFYLERGGNISYCKIKFNLPTLPEKSLTVTKEITDNTGDAGVEANEDIVGFVKDTLEYKFRVLKPDGENLYIPANIKYKILQNGVDTGNTGTTDADGYFVLKADQSAQFENVAQYGNENEADGYSYIVEEIMPDNLTGQYAGVEYMVDSGTNTETNEETGESSDFTAYHTSTLTSDFSQMVVYRNKVDVAQLSVLKVAKEVLPGSNFTANERFQFKVELGGEPLEAGTNYKIGNTTYQSEEGGYIYVGDGETATIVKGILAGTVYTVTEVIDEDANVTYESTVNGITESVNTGSFPLASTVTVTVTNSSYDFAAEIPISKQFIGNSTTDTFNFKVKVKEPDDAAYVDTGSPFSITVTDDQVTTDKITIGYSTPVIPGIYYYQITEIAGTNDIVYDSSVYIAEVEVENDNARLIRITKDDKSVETAAFINSNSITIDVKKVVAGNMGDRSKDFWFEAVMKLNDGIVAFELSPDNAYSVGVNGYAYFQLSHNDTITLYGIPGGAELTITEVCETYTASAEFEGISLSVTNGRNNDDETTAAVVIESIVASVNGSEVTFTNTYNATIDTGILLDSFPYIILFAVVGTGVILTASEKRRTFDD